MKKDTGSLARAKDYAYRLLGYRERSEKEIEERLTRRGFDKKVSDSVIAGLKTLGFIDDYKFAKRFAEIRLGRRPSGLALIKSKLYAKGVSREIINSVVSDVENDYDEYKAARMIAAERMKKIGRIENSKAKRRLYEYLLGRRFKDEVIEQVLEDLA